MTEDTQFCSVSVHPSIGRRLIGHLMTTVLRGSSFRRSKALARRSERIPETLPSVCRLTSSTSCSDSVMRLWCTVPAGAERNDADEKEQVDDIAYVSGLLRILRQMIEGGSNVTIVSSPMSSS